jgi:hypothetical protein
MTKRDIAAYARHSRWTEPGKFSSYLEALPADPTTLPEIVGGLVLDQLFAGPAAKGNPEPELRRMSDIIDAVLAKDTQPLDQARAPSKRVLGTCRNYALIACAILRQHEHPARLRVGFADYFTADFGEDHWVCEYQDGGAWRLLDAELTSSVRQHYAIAFASSDVPRDRFLTAARAWQKLRRGEGDSTRFGVSVLGLTGIWFVAASLLRDLAAVLMEEMMPWDYWGPARNFRPGAEISPDWLARFDHLADALAGLDAGYEDAGSILAERPWAALECSVLSFPQGKPVEVHIYPLAIRSASDHARC